MCAEARYLVAFGSGAAASSAAAFTLPAVTTAAATPALPSPAASRKLRRSVGFMVFMVCLLGSEDVALVELEGFGFEREEGRAERGDLAVVVGFAGASERIEELCNAGLEVVLKELALLPERCRGARGASRDQHTHRLKDAGERARGPGGLLAGRDAGPGGPRPAA